MTHPLIEQITDLIGPETDESDMGYNSGLKHAADLVAAWLAANPVGVTVKPLVWEAMYPDCGDGSSGPTGDWTAETPFGSYSIIKGFSICGDSWDVYDGEMGFVSWRNDPDAAKSAAQADYAASILAALEPTPTPVVVPLDPRTIAQKMLNAEILPDYQLRDVMTVSEEDCRDLGVKFYNGKGFNMVSDIRGDERDDGREEALTRALTAALSSTPVAASGPAETAVNIGEEVMPNDPQTTRPEDDTSPGVTAGAITPTLDALAMQRAAAKVADHYSEMVGETEWPADDARAASIVAHDISGAIMAITLPPGAALAEALRLPEIAALVEAAQYARNRLEMIADESWNGDGRDLKRLVAGVFSEFSAALAALGEQP